MHQKLINPVNVIGIVLAGGQSSRMGTDKATLIFNGESLLLRARRILQEVGCNEILMSGLTLRDWPDNPSTCIADHLHNAGPMAGIIACINARQYLLTSHISTQFLFVPVDLPLISTKQLQRLVNTAPNTDVCCYENHPLPLSLHLTPAIHTMLKQIDARLRLGESYSIRAFLQEVRSTYLACNPKDDFELRNINTPQDWNNLNNEAAS